MMSTAVKTALENTILNLKKEPEQAKALFEAHAVLGDNLKVKVGTREFKLEFDEPPVLGGENTAPNPVEYVLASLGACQAIMYRALSVLKGIALESVDVNVKGHLDLNGFLGLDKEARPGFHLVEYEATVVSGEPREKVERLAAQVEALCPVLDIISNPVKTTGKVNILKEKALADRPA